MHRKIMQDFTHCDKTHSQSFQSNTYMIHAFSGKRQLCHLGDYLIFVCMDIIYCPLCNMHSCFRSSVLHVFGRNKSLAYMSGLCLDTMRAITRDASFSQTAQTVRAKLVDWLKIVPIRKVRMHKPITMKESWIPFLSPAHRMWHEVFDGWSCFPTNFLPLEIVVHND